MAPDGVLVAPEEMFGEGKPYGKETEDKTKLAFKVRINLFIGFKPCKTIPVTKRYNKEQRSENCTVILMRSFIRRL